LIFGQRVVDLKLSKCVKCCCVLICVEVRVKYLKFVCLVYTTAFFYKNSDVYLLGSSILAVGSEKMAEFNILTSVKNASP
jgi:hypothetical protein